MSDRWDDYAEGWDTNEDVIVYSEKAYESLRAVCNIQGLRVLDFGCGTGLLTEKMSAVADSIVAIDPSEKMISILENKGLANVATIQAELSRELVRDNEMLQQKFDLIVASSALAFVSDFEQTVILMSDLLKSGGCLVQWDWLSDNGGMGFSKEDITRAYSNAGFSEIAVSLPFQMASEKGVMKVIMGVGKKS
ncbi:class I SAM-dependent DNA methyltransferase [Hahella ganghwensis]|uniref:class I SAM-dependent DNA methyltransferase n=1 Tax=Hahella ganghwensis TaxID=286420 RepID=UPI00036E71FB|nr:methyltransferase domain-containing protein [Hahella ganghwensis]